MKWRGFGPSLWEPLQFARCKSYSERLRTGDTPLLPFLSEPLPQHFSRAADGAANTIGHRTEILLTSPCRQQILTTFWSSTSCHHSEVSSSSHVPKDAQGCSIQASISQGTRMAGKGSSTPPWGMLWAPRTLLSLVLEVGKELWDRWEGLQSWEAC